MCNPTGCGFCAMLSIFGSCFMLFLGLVIQSNYPYVGEWYKRMPGQGAPTEEQIKEAAKNCFAVMGIYMGFAVMSLLFLWFFKARSRS